jgi:hypothetical protein
MSATTFTTKTFPGVYTQVVDNSQTVSPTSRFQPGLVGVATSGPMGVPTAIASLDDFVNIFGLPLTTLYNTAANGIQTVAATDAGYAGGYFLADAVDAIADLTDAITVVRIGNQYTTLAPADGYSNPNGYASGGLAYTLYSPANAQRIEALLETIPDLVLRVQQVGIASTVNVSVISASGSIINIDPSGEPFSGTYTAATISYGNDLAANDAEGVLYCYTYGTNSNPTDNPLTSFGTITGSKSQYTFTVQQNGTNIVPGAVYKIMQANKATTQEVRVASVLLNYTTPGLSGTVTLVNSNNQQVGYQASPLQDNYTSATLYQVTGSEQFLSFSAIDPGTWANGEDSSDGLYLQVGPGSAPGTKKVSIFLNSALVETQDNITNNPDDEVNFWTVRFAQGGSNYVVLTQLFGPANATAANTVNPWDARYYVTATGTNSPVVGLPSMPEGAINAGWLAVTPGNVVDTGGQFTMGYNGENPQDADWIGVFDETTDSFSGIQAFTNNNVLGTNIIAAPQDNISFGVLNALALVNAKINGFSPADVPSGLTAQQAIDWSNGQQPGQFGGRLDSPYVGVFWNWGVRTNSWGQTKLVPPTIGWLRAAAFTFSTYAPWYAIAGFSRGGVPQFTALQFNYVGDDTLQAMYGNGQSINPILNLQGVFYLYGERTLQVAQSKLSNIHALICVNWVVNGLAAIGRRFVFDPNDQQLLDNLTLAFTEFLQRIVNEQGLEDYSLAVIASAADRNNNQVIVNLGLIPTGTVERIYVNATVLASGAIVNSIT